MPAFVASGITPFVLCSLWVPSRALKLKLTVISVFQKAKDNLNTHSKMEYQSYLPTHPEPLPDAVVSVLLCGSNGWANDPPVFSEVDEEINWAVEGHNQVRQLRRHLEPVGPVRCVLTLLREALQVKEVWILALCLYSSLLLNSGCDRRQVLDPYSKMRGFVIWLCKLASEFYFSKIIQRSLFWFDSIFFT